MHLLVNSRQLLFSNPASVAMIYRSNFFSRLFAPTNETYQNIVFPSGWYLEDGNTHIRYVPSFPLRTSEKSYGNRFRVRVSHHNALWRVVDLLLVYGTMRIVYVALAIFLTVNGLEEGTTKEVDSSSTPGESTCIV